MATAAGRTKRKQKGGRKEERLRQRRAEDEEIAQLEKRLQASKPPSGSNPLAYEGVEKEAGSSETTQHQVYYPEAIKFAQLPLSSRTKKGLGAGGFTEMTEIQRATLPHSLVGRDVLAAAKTGSGKTLAFIIPVIEKLFKAKWNKLDGLGALIISPTRELALQIFEVLRTVGKEHSLSAGLVIGGKDFKTEQERIETMNILVCTPGRILQHMDQTPGFTCDNLQILVLDEADRILDMGFEKEVNAIIANLPGERQTLLFSATQTKSVRQLARLSLRDPEYIAVHEADVHNTPKGLVQHYLVCPLQDKLNILFSFLKTHTKTKILVFLSSCKQVRYVHESFRLLQPGLPVMSLHGKMHQMKRMAVYLRFCQQKHACLFATDIAARGLDFPRVDWVLQVDCPEDVATYIHRVGRTARYNSGGRALLFLLPSETKMAELLHEGKVPLEMIAVNPQRSLSILPKLQGLLAQDPALKYLAQKSFVSYMRSVHLQANKTVFDVKSLPAAEYAASLGLLGTPRIRFTQSKKQDKNLPFAMQQLLNEPDEKEPVEKEKQKGKIEKLITRRNATVLSQTYARLRAASDEDSAATLESGDSFLRLKAENKTNDRKIVPRDAANSTPLANVDDLKAKAAARFERIAQTLREEDAADRELHKQRLKEKRWADKKKQREQEQAGNSVVVLGPEEADDQDEDDDDDEALVGEQQDEESDDELPATENRKRMQVGTRKQPVHGEQDEDDSNEQEEDHTRAAETQPAFHKQKRRRKMLEEAPTDALEQMALHLLRQKNASA